MNDSACFGNYLEGSENLGRTKDSSLSSSKWSLADWIISYFPDHETYLEPFSGSGAVLFTKKRSRLETVNDIDGEIVNLFRVIRERPTNWRMRSVIRRTAGKNITIAINRQMRSSKRGALSSDSGRGEEARQRTARDGVA